MNTTSLSQWTSYLRRKADEYLLAGLRWLNSRQPVIRAAQRLNAERTYRVNIGQPDRVVILLVGCGGTGSFAAHILAQLAASAQTSGLDMRLYYIDPDKVEERNLVRQNFCQAELDQAKAFTLAWRYSAAFGLNITPVVNRFEAGMLEEFRPRQSLNGTLTLVVGAVDNFQARRDIAEAVTAHLRYPSPRNQTWWLDSGNERVNGQVVIGNSLEVEPQLSPLGYCVGLPLPHLQEPSLIQRPENHPPVDLSCADLTLLGEQSAMINRVMATWLGVYLYRLLQSRDLDLRASHLNLRTGGVSSTSITYGRVIAPEPLIRVRTPLPALPPAAGAEEPAVVFPLEDQCPDCGDELIFGRTSLLGVEVRVRFCRSCAYREEFCPVCEGQVAVEGNEVYCLDCDWREQAAGGQVAR